MKVAYTHFAFGELQESAWEVLVCAYLIAISNFVREIPFCGLTLAARLNLSRKAVNYP
jgi:hypothetical protein